MKKLTGVLLMMFASLTINAQDAPNPQKKFETKSKEWVAEMDKVLTLSEAEQKQIYGIELNKNVRIAEIRKENEGNKEAIKEEVLKTNKEAFAKMIKVLGKDKMKIWGDYRKEKMANK